jgi:glycosyltransferase involved in cell wall biosynthesis
VTVIVPTADRPQLVLRAVRSALAQSLREIEIVVVVDGPDPATTSALRALDDERLRVLELPVRGGVGAARNAGVDAARGEWVALLDDDDEWLPEKLERQLATARAASFARPIVSCRFVARDEHGDAIRPRRLPEAGEPPSEYLFCQRGLLGGEGVLLPSTILAPASLLREVRFRHARLPYEGSDWVLRALRADGTGLAFAGGAAPLAIFHGEEQRARMSNASDWRAALDWADANRDLLTPRAYAAVLLIRASLEAQRAHDPRALGELLRTAFRRGRPTASALAAHALIRVVPPALRFRIAACVTRVRPSFAPTREPA